ncbi:MAG TPA: hypothetical protein VFA09_01350 [Ktedonobacteraceae bacterium]|nr:hypothetical protein [Ktedonobacteraceae bacterium]
MRLDMAIWPAWAQCADGYRSLPITTFAEASCAFVAVEQVMRASGVRSAGHVAAACDHSLLYRGNGVRLAVRPSHGRSLHHPHGKEGVR